MGSAGKWGKWGQENGVSHLFFDFIPPHQNSEIPNLGGQAPQISRDQILPRRDRGQELVLFRYSNKQRSLLIAIPEQK